MDAVIYMGENHYMFFEAEDIKLKFAVTIILTDIKEILYYDKGLLTIDTNYGEDYVDLPEIAEKLGLNIDFGKYCVRIKQ